MLQVLNQAEILPDEVILEWYDDSKETASSSPFMESTLTKIEKFIEKLRESSDSSEDSESSASESESEGSASDD